MDDRQLLKQFTQHNSQQAFAALTARYLSLVYSTCRRELDDADLAEDVTQAVFLVLARKAPTLRREVVLSGWLFQTARFAARNARTLETRRKACEAKAADAAREQQMDTEDAAWTEIEPLLNHSLAALRDGERECVLLRFFQGLSFAEAGAALGLSEDAARKRVTRALDKMRQVFVKNGIIVPAAALAALLTAHAAKAAPSSLAGHINAGLTGPHIYISEGIIKAMKIVQIKLAVGITTTVVVGFSGYAVGRAMTLPRTTVHQVVPLTAVPKPGHVLQQTPGKTTLTAAQIAERCRAAYAGLKTYQCTAAVRTHDTTVADSQASDYNTSASISFAQPSKIHAEGIDMSGDAFAFVSDGTATEEITNGVKGTWRKDKDVESAIASVTGISQSAGTTIPALLLRTTWGDPLGRGPTDAEVREDTVQGQPCYVLTSRLNKANDTQTKYLWVDETTFLLRRIVSDNKNDARTIFIGGEQHIIPAINSHSEENFTNERLNQPIPDSTFTLPPVQ